jgi:hypothetical protein
MLDPLSHSAIGNPVLLSISISPSPGSLHGSRSHRKARDWHACTHRAVNSSQQVVAETSVFVAQSPISFPSLFLSRKRLQRTDGL